MGEVSKMNASDSDQVFYLVYARGKMPIVAASKAEALTVAWRESARTTSHWGGPYLIESRPPGHRLDARAIVAEWDALGWPRPGRERAIS
jgi:hypothetical protein